MVKIEIATVFGYNSRANISAHWLVLLHMDHYTVTHAYRTEEPMHMRD